MTALVVAAHPDDEVLGAGGIMRILAARPGGLHILILGSGATSRPELPDAEKLALQATLARNARSVADMLGVASLTLEALPDNRFDTVPLLDVVQLVERVIERIRPDTVFTHTPGDLNIDHAATFRAVLTATRPVKGAPVRDLYTFEIPSSTEWAFQQLAPCFRPNVFFDVTAHIETKIDAMAIYESEVRAYPHPRSPGALRAIAQKWGSTVGVHFAEAFELVRSIR